MLRQLGNLQSALQSRGGELRANGLEAVLIGVFVACLGFHCSSRGGQNVPPNSIANTGDCNLPIGRGVIDLSAKRQFFVKNTDIRRFWTLMRA